MSELPRALSAVPPGDFVLPFDIAKAGVRGRLVRLDLASARALSNHALPEAAARVAGESLALSVLLGTALKLDGRLTVQTKSDGPLDLIAADYYGSEDDRDCGVRGFARLDAARFADLKDLNFAALTGKGSLAITIEPKRGGNSYQGIVALSEEGLAASAETYFAQSEQLPTVLRLAAAPLFVAGQKQPHWRAAGIMLQMTPDAAKAGAAPEEMQTSDDWQRLSLMLKTVEDLELLDTELAPETVLWRLFHEDEVRVQPALPVAFRCDCAPDRIVTVLKSYAPEERAGLADPDGIIRARCEFCGTTHEIAPNSLT
ncbi:MAG TPA: Hsp33 family molecular chaperone HslO [Rhizomicrobium sp.]|jgi:molecular chaperone Hsp33|nr:Hsp33 family molecular chaperone HslO [Rhizomicrobium sp.]